MCDDEVIAITPKNQVGAGPRFDYIAARVAVDDVVTNFSINRVISLITDQYVVTIAACQ